MVVEIALGILLALFILAVGIAVLMAIIMSLPVILAYVACVGSLLLLIHFLGGWGAALWFVLIIGFISYSDRDKIFKPASTEKPVTHDGQMSPLVALPPSHPKRG